MAQAVMDPEKVRRFADELQRFNSDLENRMSMLQARFAALGDSWSDQEHEKFSEEFKLAMKALKKFVEISRQHSPYLLRKAQRIEEYLTQR
ncbi:MAG TPA: WXG100 family type VII secretion target [Verrucomicrobiae bacterium]|nr:WXG100 family type VII secretion target [Verrucomicrobiae bacterium]